MPMNPVVSSAAIVRALRLCLAGASSWVACASDQDKIGAINAVNQGFRGEYEKLLAEKGTRFYKVGRNEAFIAMRVAHWPSWACAASSRTRSSAT